MAFPSCANLEVDWICSEGPSARKDQAPNVLTEYASFCLLGDSQLSCFRPTGMAVCSRPAVYSLKNGFPVADYSCSARA